MQKDFTRHVTHLVAGQVGSTKYNVRMIIEGSSVYIPCFLE